MVQIVKGPGYSNVKVLVDGWEVPSVRSVTYTESVKDASIITLEIVATKVTMTEVTS